MRDWATRGIVSTQGRPMGARVVRDILHSPRNAGFVETPEGEFVRAEGADAAFAIPPIITPEEFRAVRAVLEQNSRKSTAKQKRTVRRRLLSGFLRCSRCGRGLNAGWIVWTSKAGVQRRPKYVCVTHNNGCGLAINGDAVDAYVTDALLGGLQHGLAAHLVDASEQESIDDLLSAIRADRVLLEQYGSDAARDGVPPAALAAACSTITERLTRNETALQRATRSGAHAVLATGDIEIIRDYWDHASLPVRRALIESCLEPVVVLPAGRGSKQPVGERLEPLRWRV
jgi:hypothetical protein